MFYTYMWLREDGTPYYVGKGHGNRAYVHHRIGNAPTLGRIVFYIAKDEADAFETEVALVWFYGRKDLGTGCLRNLTDGGENPPNGKGKKRSEHHRQAVSAGRKGLVFTQKHRDNLSVAKKGKPSSRKGKTCSEDMRRKISETLTGRKASKETRALLSKLRTGKTLITKGKPWTAARRLAQEKRNGGFQQKRQRGDC